MAGDGQDARTEDEGRAGGKEEKGAAGENVTRENQGTNSNVAREVFGLPGREAPAFTAAQEKGIFP